MTSTSDAVSALADVGKVASSSVLDVRANNSRGLFDIRAVNDDCASMDGDGHGWCEVVYRSDGRVYRRGSWKRTSRPAEAIP